MFKDIKFFESDSTDFRDKIIIGFSFWYKGQKYVWSVYTEVKHAGFMQIRLVDQLAKKMKDLLR